MGVVRPWALLAMLALFAPMGGCQSHLVSNHRLMEHQATVDFTGLQSTQIFEQLKIVAAPPRGWGSPITQDNPIYTHQQWRSPSLNTGVGVAYLHLPIPLSTSMVVWFAKQQYGERASDGKVVSEWTDTLGRDWFEAQNQKYHVRGYVISRGFEAWIVYYGYKVAHPPDFKDLAIASRSVESMIPGLDSDDDTPLPKNTPRVAAVGR